MIILAGGVFAYFRKDIDQIRGRRNWQNAQTTVSRYYDRNDVLLWEEDKGAGNYKLVVDGKDIATI